MSSVYIYSGLKVKKHPVDIIKKKPIENLELVNLILKSFYQIFKSL